MDCNWFGLVLQVEGAAGGSLPELAKAWEVAIRQAGFDSFFMPFNRHFCEKFDLIVFCKFFFGVFYFFTKFYMPSLQSTTRIHIYAFLMLLNLGGSGIIF